MYRADAAAMTAHLVFVTAIVLFVAVHSAEPAARALQSLLQWDDMAPVAQQMCRFEPSRDGDYLAALQATLWEAEGASLVPYDAPPCGR